MNEKNKGNVILSLKKIHDELNDYKLVIPDHQRPYDWRKKEWERLIRDIMNAYDDHKKGEQNSQIFLGNISLTPSKKEPGRYEVIDGQQRLTTLTVLMDYIYKRIQWNENGSKNNDTETIEPYLKIKGSNADRKSNIIEEDGSGDDNYTLTSNYFAGELSNTYQLEKNELKQLFSFIEERTYFFVEFVDESSKHNAFEKLNAAGVPLVYTDLVLNHLISMAEEEKNKTAEDIKNTWNELLVSISSEQLPLDVDESENKSEQAFYEEIDNANVDDGGSDKAKTEQLKPLKIKKFFNALHNLTLPYRESFPETVDDFIRIFDRLRKSFYPDRNETNSDFILESMIEWSNYYLAYVSPAKSGYSDEIKQHLYYLRTIGNTSVIPAVMRTLFSLHHNMLNYNDVENIFHALVIAQMLRAVYLERENTTDTANKLRIADYIYKAIPKKAYISLLSYLVPVELYKKAVELDSASEDKKLWSLPYSSGMSKAILAVRYDAVNKEKLYDFENKKDDFENKKGPVQVEHMVALKANVNPGDYGYTYDTVNTFWNLELLEADLNKDAGDKKPEEKTGQWMDSHFKVFYEKTAKAVSKSTRSMIDVQKERLEGLFVAFKEYCDIAIVPQNIYANEAANKNVLGVVSYQKDGLLIEKVIDFKEYEKGADRISVSLICSGNHYGYRSEPERKPNNSAVKYILFNSENENNPLEYYRENDYRDIKFDVLKKFLEYVSGEEEVNNTFLVDREVLFCIEKFCKSHYTNPDSKHNKSPHIKASNLIFMTEAEYENLPDNSTKKRIKAKKVRFESNDSSYTFDLNIYINDNNDITALCKALKELYKSLRKECNIDPIAFIVQMTEPEMHYLKTGERVLTLYRNLGDEEYYEEFVRKKLKKQEALSERSTEDKNDTDAEVPETDFKDFYISCGQQRLEKIFEYDLHIPEYQRAYVWEKKHYDAFIRSLEDGIPLGTIVLNYDGKKYSIVDGQQRITTLTGFLKALDPNALCPYGKENADIAKNAEKASDYLKNDSQSIGIDIDKIKKAVFNVLVIENAPTTFQYKVFGAINGCGKPLTLEEMVKNYLYGIIDEQSNQTSGSQKTAKLKKDADTIINAGFIKAYTEMIKQCHIAEDSLYDEFKEKTKSVDDIRYACHYSDLFGLLKGYNNKWSILNIKPDDASQDDKELMLWILMYRLLEVNTADALLLHVFQNAYKDNKNKQIGFMRRLIMLYFLLYVDDPNGNAKKSINSKLPDIIKDKNYASDPVKALEGEKMWKNLIIDLLISDSIDKPEYIFKKLCAFDLADRTSKKIARFILLLCELWCGLPIDTAINELKNELKNNKPTEIEHIFPANPDEKYSELLEEAKIEPPTYLFKLENVCLLEQNINKKVGNKMLRVHECDDDKIIRKTGKLEGEDEEKEIYKNSAFMMPKMFYDADGKNRFAPGLLRHIPSDPSKKKKIDIFVYDADCAKKRIEKIKEMFLSSHSSQQFFFKDMLNEMK